MLPTGSTSLSPENDRLVRVALARLHAHPANPNVMTEERRAVLAWQIGRNDRYPPLVVRPHPDRPGDYRFRTREALLPSDARWLGGRLQSGIGEYYRELRALQRTLEQDADGNWRDRWLDNGQADHFAHAEVYCLYAEAIAPGPYVDIGLLNAGVGRPPMWMERPELPAFDHGWGGGEPWTGEDHSASGGPWLVGC